MFDIGIGGDSTGIMGHSGFIEPSSLRCPFSKLAARNLSSSMPLVALPSHYDTRGASVDANKTCLVTVLRNWVADSVCTTEKSTSPTLGRIPHVICDDHNSTRYNKRHPPYMNLSFEERSMSLLPRSRFVSAIRIFLNFIVISISASSKALTSHCPP